MNAVLFTAAVLQVALLLCLAAGLGSELLRYAVAGCGAALAVTAWLLARSAIRRSSVQLQKLDALTRRLTEQATHDELTGLFNRRGFDFGLDRELARVARYPRPLSLLLVDVDCLKAINDSGGHAAGDAALRTVASALTSVARRSDIVARLGGDEFAILTTETTKEEAALVAARAHAEVAARAPAGGLTVSIGVASFEATRAQSEFLLAADIALYQAKRGGRNCTRGHLSSASGRGEGVSSVPRPRKTVPAK